MRPSKIYPTVGWCGVPNGRYRIFKAADGLWHVVRPGHRFARARDRFTRHPTMVTS